MKGIAFVLLFVALAVAGCGGSDDGPDVCSNDDGALSEPGFVIVASPNPGERVSSGFTVTGCSRTFESNVPWRLLDEAGSELASGSTTGGGVDGPGDFSFTVSFTVPERQIGQLEVIEEDPSGGEGARAPVRNVIPLVLDTGTG